MYEDQAPPRNNFNDVGAFHQKFGLDNTTYNLPGPREIDPELLSFRIKFLLEELGEFLEAVGMNLGINRATNTIEVCYPLEEGVEVDHAQAFDALLDLVYVAMGTAHLMGYPWRAGWDRVQSANITKVRAKPDGSDSKRGSSFDVVKPEGWTPPDIGEVLSLYGFPTNNKENTQ